MAEFPSYSNPQAKLIQRTANPHEELDYQVKLDAAVFSILDPESGRPQYAGLTLSYFPDEWVADQESLVLYLLCFRQERLSVEAAAGRIVNDFAEVIDPNQLRLEARFTGRDGLEATVVVQWPSPDEEEEDWEPDSERE